MNQTKIEWAEATWNPITGCTKTASGCKNCYAERRAKRFRGRFGYPADDPFRVTFHENRLQDVTPRQKPKRVFVCSMGDLFHEDVKDEWRLKVLERIMLCYLHEFVILTKRITTARRFFDRYSAAQNIVLGYSASTQADFDNGFYQLAFSHADRKVLSLEPLLGPIDLGSEQDLACIDGVIVGGESGPGARPMHPDWVRSIRDQCVAAGVPFFFKQWGAWAQTGPGFVRVGKKIAGRKLDGRTWDQWPNKVLDKQAEL